MDGVDRLPMDLQGRLAEAIERGRITRTGSRTPRPIDVRVLATTRKWLAPLVKAGAFSPQLQFALSVVLIVLPPLRIRRADVAPLAERFAAEALAREGATDRALPQIDIPTDHAWEQNVRELRHHVESTVLARLGRTARTLHRLGRRA